MLPLICTDLSVLYSTVDAGIISCNRVAVCGAIFHQICLKIQNYDIHAQDGCISCNATSQLKIVQEDDDVHHHKNVTRAKLDSGNNNANIIELDTDDDDDDTEVVVVHDC
jgi:hypothetical protein